MSVKSGVAPLHRDVVDVAVVVGDDLGDLRQRAGLVDRLQRDAGREALRRARRRRPSARRASARARCRRRRAPATGSGRSSRPRPASGCRRCGRPARRRRSARSGPAGRASRPRIGMRAVAPASPLGSLTCRLSPWRRPNQPCRLAAARGGAALVLEVGIDRLDARRRRTSRRGRRRRARPRSMIRARRGSAPLQLLVGEGLAGPLEGALEDLAAEAGILPAHRGAGRAADRGAGLAGDDERFPGGRRRLPVGADDLDLVAVLRARSAAAPCGR